jgi:hypothetical protein
VAAGELGRDYEHCQELSKKVNSPAPDVSSAPALNKYVCTCLVRLNS